jgi:hypothetical protein
MISKETLAQDMQVSSATYLCAVELVVSALNHLSGRDISGKTPAGDLRDDFGREIVAAKIAAEVQGRLGVK